MSRKSWGVEKALAFISNLCDQGPQGRLPGARSMSRRAGTSPVTMIKAIAELKRRGILETRPGNGTFAVAGKVPADAESPPGHVCGVKVTPAPQQKWQRVADIIRRDLAASHLPRRIPGAKELASRYDANYRTLRKALHLLCNQGYLRTFGRWYAPAEPDTASAGSRLVLIAFSSPDSPFEDMVPRTQELLRELDSVCIARRIRLDFVFGTYRKTGFALSPSLDSILADHGKDLFGLMFWPQGFPVSITAEVIEKIGATGLPAVILDEGDQVTASGACPARTTRIFRMATSSRCGLDMGRHLVKSGHTRIAYLCWEPVAPWSHQRLTGLRAAFGENGMDEAVVFAPLGSEHPPDFDAADFPPDMFMPPRLHGRLRRQVGKALDMADGEIHRQLILAKRQEYSEKELTRLVLDPRITAWVASNDRLALQCTAFLKQRGIPVPGKMSVAGFDNIPQARFNKLTSYSFDLQGVARQMVDTVLASPLMLARERHRPVVEVPGYVCERSTILRLPG